jgi:hypothetical protein
VIEYKETIKRFKQKKSVPWLKTPAGTIWRTYGYKNYIQPEDENLWETPFGVDLDLLDRYPDEDYPNENIFELIKEKENAS